MEVIAKAKGVRVSPKKVRRYVDMVRGKGADEVLAMLNFMQSPSARILARVIRSAVANAENNYQMAPSDMVVTKAFVDEATKMKRVRFQGRGRVSPYRRRSSHITVVVEEM